MERFYKTIKLENNLFRKLTSKEVKMQARIWINKYNDSRYHSAIKDIPAHFGNRKLDSIELVRKRK
jgi:hypothetical protein